MTLFGDLESFSLGSLLQVFGSDRKTGMLHLRRDASEAFICFKEGGVFNAWESGGENRIGNFLKSKGRISSENLHAAMASAHAAGVPLHQVLVDQGYVTSAQMLKLRRQAVEETIYALFLWDQGEFEFRDGPPDANIEALTFLSTMGILLEASRRVDEMSLLQERISSPCLVFKLSDHPAQNKITLSPAEWRILSLIDGRRDVRQLISESGFTEFVTYKILYALSGAGLVRESEGVASLEGDHLGKPAPERQKSRTAHTILVVDDMKQIRNILRFSLKKEGYHVVVADNGETALQYALGARPPNLIVLDIMMPRIDGYEVLRRLRQSDATRQTPVIFLTSKAQKADVLKGITLGGNDYVLKPYKFAELHQKIRRLLGQEELPEDTASL